MQCQILPRKSGIGKSLEYVKNNRKTEKVSILTRFSCLSETGKVTVLRPLADSNSISVQIYSFQLAAPYKEDSMPPKHSMSTRKKAGLRIPAPAHLTYGKTFKRQNMLHFLVSSRST
jgi:hypothetical protein